MEKLTGTSNEWRQGGIEQKEHQRFEMGYVSIVVTEMNNMGGHRRKQSCWYSNSKYPQGE